MSFVWTSFTSVEVFCDTSVLADPDLFKSFKLEVDANAVGVRAVFLQKDTFGVYHTVML